jgi:hypothetical protein
LLNVIQPLKLTKFAEGNSSGENLLKKIIGYEKLVENLNNKEYLISLIGGNQNETKEEIEKSSIQQYNKDHSNLSDVDPEIQSFVQTLKDNSHDAKKVLDLTLDFLYKNEQIKNGLIKNKENLEKYIPDESSSNMMRFSEAKGIEDIPPPMPYMSLDTPCMNTADCTAKKLMWMKCTVQRVAIRSAYEFMNIPLNAMSKMLFASCACVLIPKGKDKIQSECNNTSGQPAIICTIPNQVYKGVFKMSFETWKAYQMISHTCFSPINPFI